MTRLRGQSSGLWESQKGEERVCNQLFSLGHWGVREYQGPHHNVLASQWFLGSEHCLILTSYLTETINSA